MTDTERLKAAIQEAGIKKAKLISCLGLTYAGFRNKLNNKNRFMADEIVIICNVLRLTDKERDEIFFTNLVDKKGTKEAL